jgi:hypothetical protein
MVEIRGGLSRRHVLRAVAGGALAGGLVTVGALPAAALAGPARTGGTSANGWPAQPGGEAGDAVRTIRVPGTDVSVAVLGGDVAVVLVHVIRRFHYEIDQLRHGEVGGHRAAGVFPTRHETNHASGTAVDIRADWYPPGTRNGFFPHESDVIRDILADCEGVVRWGADLTPVDESHFQIDVAPDDARLRHVASKIRGWDSRPGAGAGVLVDPLTPARRKPALVLQRRQRTK